MKEAREARTQKKVWEMIKRKKEENGSEQEDRNGGLG